MSKGLWLVFVLISAALTAACGEVESCKEGSTLGCINTLPKEDKTCLFDLVLVDGRCVKPGTQGSGCEACLEGEQCVDGRCVNFCAEPQIQPGSIAPPAPIFCVATETTPGTNPMLEFREVCIRQCQLAERQLQNFCPGYVANPTRCESAEVQDACVKACPNTAAGARDLACLTGRCEDTRRALCSVELKCPNQATPTCVDKLCTNDCRPRDGKSLIGNGVCDDGDPYTTNANGWCAWGTDCIDCGPRSGQNQNAVPIGGLCEFLVNCAGTTEDLVQAEAWCVAVNNARPQGGIGRCLPDCTLDTEFCPQGFECRTIKVNGADFVREGLTAKACIPLACE